MSVSVENLCRYLGQHGLPAHANAGGTITTVNEYIAPDRSYHAEPITAEPITIPATWSAVREFLAY